MTDQPEWMTAEALTAAYRAGRLSPVEVTRHLLDRIGRIDPRLNAFNLVDGERSLAGAAASEARWRAGSPKGLLDGVPVAVKDILLVEDWPTLRGSKTIDKAGPWRDTAPAVARALDHGAVLLGRTTTPEYGWKGVTDSPLTGITRNPWNLEMTPGGSSGGSSAALAAGLVPLAFGTDGGGSIRIPCGFTGTVGIKPSFGRVPAWPLSPFGTVSHIGPMARTVRDCARMLQAIAQYDARDWFALPFSVPDYLGQLDRGISGRRIAYSRDLGFAEVHPAVAAVVEAAIHHLADAGAEVVEATPPMASPLEIFKAHWYTGAAFALGQLPPEKAALLDPGLREVIAAGQRYTLRDYQEAVAARGAYGVAMNAFMADFDFLVTPTLAVPAFTAGSIAPAGWDAENWLMWTPFTWPFNLTQQPAGTVPCGLTAEGLPVGLQVIGRMHDDTGVLQAMAAFEKRSPPPAFPEL